MKKLFRLALSAISVAVLSVSLSAAAATAYNGDLIIGFTAGSGNDVIYDLGAASSLNDGQTWDLSSLLSGYTLSGVHWGVVGNTLNGIGGSADNTVYTTTISSSSQPNSLNQSGYNAVFGQVRNMYGLFPAAGAGQHVSVSSTLANSWNSQTFNPSLTTQYKNAYEDPNVTGLVSDVLWGVDTQGAPTTELGSFTLGSSGGLTFNTVVPEPSACALVAWGGLLMFSLRRQLGFKA